MHGSRVFFNYCTCTITVFTIFVIKIIAEQYRNKKTQTLFLRVYIIPIRYDGLYFIYKSKHYVTKISNWTFTYHLLLFICDHLRYYNSPGKNEFISQHSDYRLQLLDFVFIILIFIQ